MSGENKQNDNIAGRTDSVSAGLPEERREEGLRSPDFSSESISEDGEKEAGDGVAADDASRRVERRTREEIESQYRNDPRLSMLFNHEEKKKKTVSEWSINVGGLRLTAMRILILVGFLLVFLLCLGGSLYYAFKDMSKYKDFTQASALLESGDYEGARNLFIRVLSEDPNKEEAVAALAQIYHYYGDWNNEAFLRQRIMRLNPLNQEYFYEFLESAFRARNFGTIYSLLNLKVMDNPELPPEEGSLYLIAALNSGHASNGKSFYENRKKADPDYFSETERGRVAEMLLNAPNMSFEEAQNHLASLDQIQDSQTRFEVINMLLPFFMKRGDRESNERVDNLLHEAVELNEYAGAPMLARYYFFCYRFDDTIKICEDYFKTKINAVMPILYGESCILSGQPELLSPLLEKMRRLRSGRQSRIIVSYLDALGAFQEGDDARLQILLQAAGATIETPLSSLMRYHLVLKNDSPKEILFLLTGIMRSRPFLDFQQRARTAALEYLLKKANAGELESNQELLTVCAEIASLIQTPDDDAPFLQRIILTDHFKRNVLTEDELQRALRSFPDDPLLLSIAAEFYLANGNPDRAMEYVAEYKDLDDLPEKIKSSVDVLHMLALEQLGRKDEAEKEFRALVERGGDETVLALYFEFCVENEFVDSLKSLCQWIESLPKDSSSRADLPFVRAEILLAEGKQQEALDLFEKAAGGHPRFTFHAAARLAEAGRTASAIRHFLSIRNTYPDRSRLEIRLSELYTKAGDTAAALECARTAWQEDRNSLSTRYIYGRGLAESGRYADAVSVLKFPQYKASFPKEMLDVWANAIREQIKADFAAERYNPAMESVKHLLIYFPDDAVGRDYLERIERIRRHETVGGSAA